MPASFKHSLLGLGGLGIALALAGCGGADVIGPSTTATALAFGERSSADAAGGRYPAGLALYMADKLADAGDYRTAVTIYRMAHRQNPEDPAGLLGLGESLRRLGANVEAEQAFRLADARSPKNPDILRGHGNNLVALGRPKAALKKYRTALRLTPDDPRLFNGIGVALDLIGAHLTAQARYREGLKITPDNASLHNNLGLSLVLSGNYADAIASLGEFAEGPERNASHRQVLALAYGFAGRMDRAAAVARMDLDETAVQNNLNYIASLRALDDKERTAAVLGYSGKMARGNQMALAGAEEAEPLTVAEAPRERPRSVAALPAPVAVAALNSPVPPRQVSGLQTSSRQAVEPAARPAPAAPGERPGAHRPHHGAHTGGRR